MKKPIETYGSAHIGGPLLHEAIPQLMYHFPEATALDLYGASATFNFTADTVTLRCGAREKVLPLHSPSS